MERLHGTTLDVMSAMPCTLALSFHNSEDSQPFLVALLSAVYISDEQVCPCMKY